MHHLSMWSGIHPNPLSRSLSLSLSPSLKSWYRAKSVCVSAIAKESQAMAIGAVGARCPSLFASLRFSLLSRASKTPRPPLSLRRIPFVSTGSRLVVGIPAKRWSRASIAGCSCRRLSVTAKVAETEAAVEETSREGGGEETFSNSSPASSSVSKFKKRLRIADIKGGDDGGLGRVGEKMVVRGWVRTCRLQKTFTFIEVHTFLATSASRKKLSKLLC